MRLSRLIGVLFVSFVMLAGWTHLESTTSSQPLTPAVETAPDSAQNVELDWQAGDDLFNENCFMCSKSDSKDACKGAEQCKGTREECRKKGCKITGTRSCSTAANVKTC